jgi:hypothetical protein
LKEKDGEGEGAKVANLLTPKVLSVGMRFIWTTKRGHPTELTLRFYTG